MVQDIGARLGQGQFDVVDHLGPDAYLEHDVANDVTDNRNAHPVARQLNAHRDGVSDRGRTRVGEIDYLVHYGRPPTQRGHRVTVSGDGSGLWSCRSRPGV